MRYFLDTDICSYLLKRSHPALIEHVRPFAPRELKVSVITVFELEFGAHKHPNRDALLGTIHAFLDNLQVVPFELSAAREASAVRAELTAIGEPIGAYDFLIAGHARSAGATLVTNNVREFRKVRELRVENWTSKTESDD